MPGAIIVPPTPVDLTRVTVGGIDARVVLDGSFGYAIDDRGPTRTITYQVTDRGAPSGKSPADFCDALLGIGSFASKPFGWPQPHRYPYNTALVCVRAQGRPVAACGAAQAAEQIGDHNYALVEGEFAHIVADYQIHQFDVYGEDHDATLPDLRDVPWSSLEARGGFEEYAIEQGTFTDAAGASPARKIKKVMLHVDYIFRRSMIPVLADYDAILASLAGTVNDDIFMGKARGTVRIQPWDQTYNWDASGKRVQEFTMPLRWRPYDWNAEPVAGTADTWTVVKDPSGNYNYPYASYLPIVQYGLLAPPPTGGTGTGGGSGGTVPTK